MLAGSQPPTAPATRDSIPLVFIGIHTYFHIPTHRHICIHIIKKLNIFTNGPSYWMGASQPFWEALYMQWEQVATRWLCSSLRYLCQPLCSNDFQGAKPQTKNEKIQSNVGYLKSWRCSVAKAIQRPFPSLSSHRCSFLGKYSCRQIDLRHTASLQPSFYLFPNIMDYELSKSKVSEI